jgi:uncharacterized membrane protein YkvA (DUF1232 family)
MMNKALMKELALLVPNLVMLTGRIAMDSRVPWETKTALAAGAAYIVAPVDAIPDFIPVLGKAEDALVALLLLDGIVNQLDPAIVEEHWRGDRDTLDRLRHVAKTATGFVPTFIRERVLNKAFYTPGKGVEAITRFAQNRMGAKA